MRRSHPSRAEHPRAAFRVGVSGAVTIEPEQLDRVRDQVAEVLATIHDEVLRCAKTQPARHVYDPGSPPLLRLISPLAEGADRLVAEAALKDFQLEAPLPFDVEAYKATFARKPPEAHEANVATFEQLLAAAGPRVLTLDGDRLDDIDRHRSYEAVGRLVVRNCDLMIAIWDNDKPSRGRGGTADTIRYALRSGVPVWWIHASRGGAPRWLQDTIDLPRLGTGGAADGSGQDRLRNYIARAILPPDPTQPEFESIWDRVLSCARRILAIQADPLLAYLDETGEPNRKFWNQHPKFIGALRGWGGRLHEKRTARRGGTTGGGAPVPGGTARGRGGDASPD